MSYAVSCAASWPDRLPLTAGECRARCRQVGIQPGEPTLPRLRDILAKVQLHTCYSNIAMLTRTPPHAPTRDEIAADVLSGLGGVCSVTRVFLHSLPAHPGFDSRLLPCYRSRQQRRQPVHIGIQVRLGGGRYYLDAGNGYPYFAPCRFGADEAHHCGGLSYRLRPDGDKGFYALEHWFAPGSHRRYATAPHTALLVEDRPVGRSHFDEMTGRNYTQSAGSRLLRRLRLVKFRRRGMYALRYSSGGKALIFSKDGRLCSKELPLSELTQPAKREFPAAAAHVDAAVRTVTARLSDRQVSDRAVQ